MAALPDKTPKFSIISVNKNNGAGLRKTLSSIESQGDSDYEVIVVDAHSTDCSQEVINQFDHMIHKFLLENEPGIYSSMNQAVFQARGEWVIFLNSGDRFYSDEVLRKFSPAETSDVAFGRAWIEDRKEPAKYNGLENIWKGMPFCHQATFVKRAKLVERPFDTRFKIVADYKFLVDSYLAKLVFEDLDQDICRIEMPGKSGRQVLRRLYEKYKVAAASFPDKPVAAITICQLAREYKYRLSRAFTAIKMTLHGR